MDGPERFFSRKNTVDSISESESFQNGNYLEAVEALCRVTYRSMYVIDYQLKKFEYVSKNPLFLCGHSPLEVLEMGYDFYFKHVAPEDLEMLIKVNEVGFNFFDKSSPEDRKKFCFSYDFHLINENKEKILINHKLTPIFITEEGKIWKALCVVSLSPNTSAGNIILHKEGSPFIWKLNLAAEKWVEEEKVKLSERELQILRFYAQGLTINQIAENIFLAPDTVKFHRRKLFDKLNVKNITEALAYATNYKLI
ncbi:response regulator transcription factor [Chryseobacterium sp. MFBS3-17]|uniref:response regulator transcription factor n=1 Tax=Chryseobacterium sp. MFBS3-17 TaxID=2886689 RepID=UPI001D0E0393|nr:LuxR C-terminal-related transcriptional regulator [Chryseobacterium sp. MFBS3-17]MCC2590314.1 LuxR C-terminal-related transcriptional regulator [Chryseobacterium sp. MFBS3-17]